MSTPETADDESGGKEDRYSDYLANSNYILLEKNDDRKAYNEVKKWMKWMPFINGQENLMCNHSIIDKSKM